MTVNKSKTVEVELSRDDVIEAIKRYAQSEHPSLKKSDGVKVVLRGANNVETPGAALVDAKATFTFNGKSENQQ